MLEKVMLHYDCIKNSSIIAIQFYQIIAFSRLKKHLFLPLLGMEVQ